MTSRPTPQADAATPIPAPIFGRVAQRATLGILAALSFSHAINDTVQSVVPAIYPLLKTTFALSFAQIGLITLVNQMTASLLQPLVGWYTDKWPKPFSLAIGMTFSLAGLVLLARAGIFPLVLVAVAFIGVGSSVFHPEASRIARLASGGRHGFAQSLFQVGGNAGSSLGPLLAWLVILPHGQGSVLWTTPLAVIGIVLLYRIGRWYRSRAHAAAAHPADRHSSLPRGRVALALGILVALVFSKYFYLTSMTSYFMFFLVERFHITREASEIYLFGFLAAVAVGTFLGGPLGDRFGRKRVIWASIFGTAPFALLLPYANLPWTAVLSVIIGIILASAMSAIIVYAQELVPGRVGTIAGLFFGLAFGLGGIGSAVLGVMADHIGIVKVYQICSFLPLLGLLASWLPDMSRKQAAQ
jgi:FSR family fosmidomycin resistance protein-like MFS transporter